MNHDGPWSMRVGVGMGSMSGPVTPYSNRPSESGLCRDSVDGRILAVRVIVGIRQRVRVDALTTLVCTSIDGVTPITFALGHSCARCGGRAHMKSSTREEEESVLIDSVRLHGY